MHMSSRNAQTTNITNVDKSRFTCACSSALRWDLTHWDEEVLIRRLTNCTPCTGPPSRPYDLHRLSLSKMKLECVGSRSMHTHTHTHIGRQNRAVTGLMAAGLFSFLWSSAVCPLPLSLSLCVSAIRSLSLERGLFAQWFMTKVTVASPQNALLPGSQATGSFSLPISLSWEIPNEFLRPEFWQNLRLLW